MLDRTYYVICEDKCLFEAMTKEQIIAAIAEATGSTPTDVDSAFITKIKEQNANRELKFWVGTQAQYNAIAEPAEDTFYLITDPTFESDIRTELEGLQTEIAELNALKPIDVSDKITLTSNDTESVGVANKQYVFDPASGIMYFTVALNVKAEIDADTSKVISHTGGYAPKWNHTSIMAQHSSGIVLHAAYQRSVPCASFYFENVSAVIPGGTIKVNGFYFCEGE